MSNYVWLTVLTLAQAVLIALKIIERRNGRRMNNGAGLPCREHGEKLAALDAKVDMLEKTIERIERKINGK
jgi:hypothetical protein